MTASTKKLIGIAAIALIGYELWKREQAQAASWQSSFSADTTSAIPIWGQQLSAETTGSTTTTTTTIDDLLSIPQGPGGTYVNYGPGTGGFFGGADCILPPALSM